MAKKKVAIVGYGTIGERIADGVALQDDMEVAGVVDVAPTLPVMALAESGRNYSIYCSMPDKISDLENAGIQVQGTWDELLPKVDVVIDATTPGIGKKNKETYEKYNLPAVFQGGEKNVADAIFHPMFNYDQGKKLKYLQMFSCNTTGIARQAYVSDNSFGLKEMICSIVRRSADISETHKGPVDALLPQGIPTHQAEDFHHVAPHIHTVTSVITAPVCHGHATMMIFEVDKSVEKEEVVEAFKNEPRVRMFKLKDGFLSTSHIFDYNRDRLSPRGDMFEVPVWDESIYIDKGGKRVYSINMIPQEAIVVPENIDSARALLKLEDTAEEAMDHTNRNLGIK